MRFKTVFGFMLIFLIQTNLFTLTSTAKQEVDFTPDLEELAKTSDLILMGQISRLEQDPRHTWADFEVFEVYQGNIEDHNVRVLSFAGKVMVDTLEPQFTKGERAILFLEKFKNRNLYRCVQGKRGKKVLINSNVYIFPDDSFIRINVRKYVDYLKNRSAFLKTEAKKA